MPRCHILIGPGPALVVVESLVIKNVSELGYMRR